jgi:large subunit ribosomal protein L23
MALLDFLKRKKEIEKSKKPFDKIQGKPEKKAEKVSVAVPTGQAGGRQAKTEKKKIGKTEPTAEKVVLKSAKKSHFSYEVISRPHISEKATYLGEKNQYIFEILPNYNKKEVKKAVEGIYGVNVLSVNMIKIPAKKRRLGKTQGFRKKYSKAVVTVKEGQKIEIL